MSAAPTAPRRRRPPGGCCGRGPGAVVIATKVWGEAPPRCYDNRGTCSREEGGVCPGPCPSSPPTPSGRGPPPPAPVRGAGDRRWAPLRSAPAAAGAGAPSLLSKLSVPAVPLLGWASTGPQERAGLVALPVALSAAGCAWRPNGSLPGEAARGLTGSGLPKMLSGSQAFAVPEWWTWYWF